MVSTAARSQLEPHRPQPGWALGWWLGSRAPFGLLTLNGLVIPILRLFHYQESRTSNMVLILLFGVIANWALLAAVVGAVLAQRSASRAT